MGRYQREKGKRGEREVVALFKEQGFQAERTSQYCGRSSDSSDVRVKGLHDFNIESKLGYSSRLDSWYEKALEEAPDKTPLIFHRRDAGTWLCTVSADWLIGVLAHAKKEAL